ncbi:MAG: hypothetical protein COU07_03875 [Candidatus Harrisonbacteria bacterium CG10_big_fil_rev_8_21_14_0_10_40_38]|uniref:Major facilitator superfamily (MFS) profile domain-containing protein n=1 Tax=Candidatus Harrisonbacteria bacterium CG10_big_fil_rev_8_21_14_0_10_40_38 TaxID=1974583 RepID=A0A2H0URI3_9BACT|nr:MAG: hypothetical protein COU07_03875 [Candidatus Harrisonbacteria bacterium CG10_big_fil_rev_8_21_14_0_10_40_38]
MFSHINRVVKLMVITDFFVNSAFGSFAPIFAIFIADRIAVGNSAPEIAGFATSVYWIVKSAVQLPIARFLDRIDGDRAKFWAVFIGYICSGFVPFFYTLISAPWHLYVLQGFLGLCMAFAVPAWYGLFTRHVDKWRISFEWSLESVFSVGIATALASAFGGYAARVFGFDAVFIGASVLAILSSFLFVFLYKDLTGEKKPPLQRVFPERRHRRLQSHK